MLNYLNYLNIVGPVAIILVVIILASDLIKAIKIIFEFIAAHVLKIKTKAAKKKEKDEKLSDLVFKNNVELQEFMKNQVSFNQELRNEVSGIKNEMVTINSGFTDLTNQLNNLTGTVSDMQLENMRETILDFESAISTPNGPIYGKDKYNYIRNVYKLYKDMLSSKGKTDDDTDLAMRNINEEHEYNVLHHAFIEDIINKKDNIKEEIRDEVEKTKTNRKRSTKKSNEE